LGCITNFTRLKLSLPPGFYVVAPETYKLNISKLNQTKEKPHKEII